LKLNHKILLVLLILKGCFSLEARDKDGLVADYNFNEGKTGTKPFSLNCASPVNDRFGNVNSAYYFHGSAGSYINLGNTSILKPKEGTISLWFNIDYPIEAGNGYELNPLILTKCSNEDDFYEAYCIYYMYKTKKIGVAVTQSSLNQVGLHSDSQVTLRQWHHAAVTFDHKFLTFYFDGKLEGKIIKNFDNQYLDHDSVMIGSSANTKNKRFFNGAIDDIRIFNRVLNKQEIEELYHEPNPNRKWEVIKVILWILAALLFVAAIAYVVNRRYQRSFQKEIEKNKMKSLVYETEIKALKANMNPHFIFNSLNSIQQFILSNDSENAYTYLSKFSKLLRKSLESNLSESINLEDEIYIIEHYLEIESLRFEKAFSYEIVIEDKINIQRVYIPPMLVQPFVENAVWHGLLHKTGKKELLIHFTYNDEKRINCIIMDNGVGRDFIKNITLNKKSIALDLIQQRLELFKKTLLIECGYEIIDITDEQGISLGTRVELTIPIVNRI
jgi:hypothetical protein